MTAADDDLLARVVAGDLDPESQVWKAALARDPALAARWQELTVLLGALDRTGVDERAALARGRAEASSTDFERIRAAAARGRTTGRRGPWWRPTSFLYLVAAAAVVAVVGFLALDRLGGPASKQPTYLGDQRFGAFSPTLTEGDARLFQWERELPAGGAFYVYVFEIDGANEFGRMVAESGPCTEHTWKPSETDLARIPNEFFWQVEVRRAGDPSGELSAMVRARRSRP